MYVTLMHACEMCSAAIQDCSNKIPNTSEDGELAACVRALRVVCVTYIYIDQREQVDVIGMQNDV